MVTHFRFCLRPLLCSLFLAAATAVAQQAAAPVPAAILSAGKVFLSNAGSDGGLFPHPFSGTPDRPYSQLYAALKSWGQYDLVGDPAEADLVLELRLLAPNGPANADKTKGASDPLPTFRLVIYDRKTHYVLWALTESIDGALMQKGHDHNFDEALDALLDDLKQVTGKTPAHAQAIPKTKTRLQDQ